MHFKPISVFSTVFSRLSLIFSADSSRMVVWSLPWTWQWAPGLCFGSDHQSTAFPGDREAQEPRTCGSGRTCRSGWVRKMRQGHIQIPTQALRLSTGGIKTVPLWLTNSKNEPSRMTRCNSTAWDKKPQAVISRIWNISHPLCSRHRGRTCNTHTHLFNSWNNN